MKKLIIFAIIINILLYIFSELDASLNKPTGNPHTETMLWGESEYHKIPELNFFEFEIHSSPDTIKIIYKIKNISDKNIDIQINLIDIAVVTAVKNTIGDPGAIIWRWSQTHNKPYIETIHLAPNNVFKEEINIDRENLPIESQYYINAYYKDYFVAQYKIIEGL